MSSLPPYNPILGDRAVWLCPLPDDGGLPADLPTVDAPWGAAVVDREALAAEVRQRFPSVEVSVVPSPADVAVLERSWLLVAAHPVWCEVILRRLMGMPPGTATFTLVPGAVSVVQLLPGRAVLVRLNDGRALG
jgi:hypothetical protein